MHSKLRVLPVLVPRMRVEPGNGSRWQMTLMFSVVFIYSPNYPFIDRASIP